MTYLKKGILALLLILPFACKNPTDNLKIVVDTNIIKYTALLHITDSADPGKAPANTTITIGGSAASNIYEASGKKNFTVVNGVITIGLGPAASPTAGNPLSCTVQISAPGYTTTTQTVTFTADQTQQVINIPLVKTGSTAPVVIPPPAPTVNPDVSLDFTGTCSNKPDLLIKPSLYVFYRVNGSGAAYQYLGYMESGKITTKALALGKTYDFQITYGGQNYVVTQLIQQSGYALTLDMGTACNNF
ncbi:hypothetical protein GCM10027037_17520 [Mucilaginibacter koreensis]